MKRGARPFGYTILEVMIVLTITSVLFVSGAYAFRNEQQQTEFTQGTRDLETKIRDVVNGVNSGRHDGSTPFRCTAPPLTGTPSPSPGADTQGTRTDCVYLGKVLHFGVSGACTNQDCMNIFTVTGRRITNGKESATLTDASPKVIDSPVDLTENYQLRYGLHTTAFWQLSGTSPAGAACPCSLGAMGLFMTLGQYDTNNDIVSGSTIVDSVPILGTNYPSDRAAVIARVNSFLAQNEAVGNKNPAQGFLVCLRDSRNRRTSGVVIGRDGRQGTVEALFAETLSTFTNQAQFGGAVTCA